MGRNGTIHPYGPIQYNKDEQLEAWASKPLQTNTIPELERDDFPSENKSGVIHGT